MGRRIDVAGVALELEADDPGRWPPVEALFGGCRTTTAAPAVRIIHRAAPPPVPSRPPDLRTPEVEVWFEDEGVVARHASGSVGRRRGDVIVVGGVDGDDRDRAFRLATQHPLIDAVAVHGHHAVHGAALERDGRALLLLGPSGAGKSTLAYAGSQGGWRIVADDLCLVEAGPRLSGMPKPVNVPADLLVLPPAGSRRLPDDERRRWALPPEAITARGQYPVAGVVLVGHGEGGGGATRLPPGPTRLEMLLGSLPLVGVPHAVRAYFPVAGQLSRLPGWDYRHPPAVEDRVAAAVTALDAMWAAIAGPQ